MTRAGCDVHSGDRDQRGDSGYGRRPPGATVGGGTTAVTRRYQV